MTATRFRRPDGMGGTINVCVAQPKQDLGKRKASVHESDHVKKSNLASSSSRDNKLSITSFFARQ